MLRLLLPLVIILVIAIYNICKGTSNVSREKARREAEHREYMNTYNTRRQLFSEMYNTSRKYKLTGCESDAMQSNLSRCKEDDEVIIEYNGAQRKYAATCDGAIIGFLPQQADSVMSKLSRISDYKVIISELGFTAANKCYANITIFCNE